MYNRYIVYYGEIFHFLHFCPYKLSQSSRILWMIPKWYMAPKSILPMDGKELEWRYFQPMKLNDWSYFTNFPFLWQCQAQMRYRPWAECDLVPDPNRICPQTQWNWVIVRTLRNASLSGSARHKCDIVPEPNAIWSQTQIEFPPTPNEIGSLFVFYELSFFVAVPGTNVI